MVVRIRRYIVAGLLVWLPIGATILVFRLLLDLINRLIPERFLPEAVLGFYIPGQSTFLAPVLAFLVLVLTGGLVSPDLGLYVAMAQIPIYLLPLIAKPFYGRLLAL